MLPIYSIHDILEKPKAKYKYAIDVFKNFTITNPVISHRHNFYEILWIKSGNGMQAIDFQEYAIEQNQVYFIAPGEIHHWSILNDVNGIAFMFTEEFYMSFAKGKNLLFQNTFFSNPKNRMIHLKKKDINFLDSLFDFLNEEQNKKDSEADISMHTGIDLYLAFLNRKYRTVNSDYITKENHLILQLKALIYGSLTKTPSLLESANALGVTMTHLQNILKENQNITLKQLIIDAQIMEAKRRLLYTHESIHEISIAVGFSDQSYFTRLFKKRTKLSPSDFRIQTKKS